MAVSVAVRVHLSSRFCVAILASGRMILSSSISPSESAHWNRTRASGSIASASNSVTSIHALRTLEALGGLSEDDVKRALHDKNPGVREHAIELAESRLSISPVLVTELLALAMDPDARVRFQCALSLGDIDDDKII